MISLVILLWGYSPGRVDEQAAEEQQQVVAELGGRDVQGVTQTALPKSERVGITMNPPGAVLSERIPIPSGFQRTDVGEGSFQDYIRSYPSEPDGSPVILYDGSEEGNQTAHQVVSALSAFDSDLQQCMDSLVRMYGEYLQVREAGGEIAFHLINGSLMDYPSWREGNRLSVDGNQISWIKKAFYDDSYETFLLYTKYVMTYAGTLSLDNECTVIDMSLIKTGDMFIKGGSLGHCVMITDMAVNGDRDICFLLAQGYIPAQDFHILSNPFYMDDPWYYASESSYPLKAPEYVFQEGSLKRWYFSDLLQGFGRLWKENSLQKRDEIEYMRPAAGMAREQLGASRRKYEMDLKKIHHAAIIVSDHGVSRRFYVELLGLKVIRENYRSERDDYKLDLELDGYELELFSGEHNPPGPSYPEALGLRHLAFRVEDMDVAAREFSERGADTEPVRMDQFTGRRMTLFHDPDGLSLELRE